MRAFRATYSSKYDLSWLLWAAGVGLTLWGCFLWTRLKKRHWAWLFLGLLTPIGLIPLALIKDKSKPEEEVHNGTTKLVG